MRTVRWREGDVIRKLREVAGWKLKEYAAVAGVNVQVIHKIEKGVTKEASRATLEKLVKPFRMTVGQFLDAIPKQTFDVEIPAAEAREKARGQPRKAGTAR